MNDAGVAPPGVIPIQHPITQFLTEVAQYSATPATSSEQRRSWPECPNLRPLPSTRESADAEQPDDCDQEIEPVEQLLITERHSKRAGHRAEPHRASANPSTSRQAFSRGCPALSDEVANVRKIRRRTRRPELKREAMIGARKVMTMTATSANERGSECGQFHRRDLLAPSDGHSGRHDHGSPGMLKRIDVTRRRTMLPSRCTRAMIADVGGI